MTHSTQNQRVKFSTVIVRNESREILRASITTTRFFGLLKHKKTHFEINGHEQQRLQCDENGTSFRLKLKKARDRRVVFEEQVIKTCQRITIDFTGGVELEFLEMRVANQSDKQKQIAFIEKMKKNNYYEILQVHRNTTHEKIHRSYLRLVRLHHPDRNLNTLESSIFITQKLGEAYTFLMDSNNRVMYNKFLDYNGGFFSLSRWRAFFADHHRWPYLLVTTLFTVAGIGLTITAVALAPIGILLLGGCAIGGALISGGTAGIRKVLSQDAAVRGVKFDQMCKIVGVNAAFGAIVGLVGAGAGLAFLGVISPALSGSVSRLVSSAISGTASGALTGAAGGAGCVIAKAIAEDRWKDMYAGACTRDLVLGAVVGAGTGAITGGSTGACVAAVDVQAVGGSEVLVGTDSDQAVGYAAIQAGKNIAPQRNWDIVSPSICGTLLAGASPVVGSRSDNNAFQNGAYPEATSADFPEQDDYKNNIQTIHNYF